MNPGLNLWDGIVCFIPLNCRFHSGFFCGVFFVNGEEFPSITSFIEQILFEDVLPNIFINIGNKVQKIPHRKILNETYSLVE